MILSTLNGGIGADDQTLTVVDGGVFPQNIYFKIKIDHEISLVKGVSTNTFTPVSRGIDGTLAETHADGAQVDWVIDDIYHWYVVDMLDELYDFDHYQNTDWALLKADSTLLLDDGTLKQNLDVDAGVTIDGVDISDISTDYVAKSLYDAKTILIAETDNTPVAALISGTALPGTGVDGQTFVDTDLPGFYVWVT